MQKQEYTANFLQIDRAALARNAKACVEAVKVPVIAVVKFDGYGVGLEAAAKAWQSAGVTTFAVSESWEALSLRQAGFTEDIAEDGKTFAENAVIKAEAVCAATGLPAIADDSGLEVTALGGEPGVYSARYAGEHGNDDANNDLLLRKMENITDREAYFVCALALKLPGREPVLAEGRCPGVMLRERRGTGGFGYDPLFLYEPLGKTFAQVNEEEKNAISHRARACAAMKEKMKELS